MSGSIFHYTTSSGLLGIITNNNLHATHWKFLNDLTEIPSIKELLISKFQQEIEEITPYLIENKYLCPSIYDEFGKEVHRKEAESIYWSIVNTNDKIYPTFVCSFCRHEADSFEYSNGLLSQWRGYGGSGGFAIEFDETLVDKLLENEANNNFYYGIKSSNVVYQDHQNAIDADGCDGDCKGCPSRYLP